MHNAAWIACHIAFLILDTIFINNNQSIRILDIGAADVNGNQKDAIKTSGFHHLDEPLQNEYKQKGIAALFIREKIFLRK